ncbi:MAG: hypothetical protein IJK89_05515 [Clostridia bacterium]|nr:hypothetical protein [Clostridia bacterium]
MKILYLGNSITRHLPAPEIGWHGQWGMAASAPENDYVHRLNALLEAAGKNVNFLPDTVVEAEREPERFSEDSFRPYTAFAPDAAIFRLGENVPDEKAAAFGETLERMIRLFAPACAVYVVGSFWKKDDVEDALRRAAQNAGARYVSLAPIQRKEYQAVGQFAHEGVAAHPSDKGMDAIARTVFDALRADGLLQGAAVAPLPEGEPKYGDIAVTVDGRPVDCYAARVSAIPFNRVWPGRQRPLEQTEQAPFLPLTLTGCADFRVRTGEAPADVAIRPLSKRVAHEVVDGEVRFTLREPGQYTVEINGRHHALHIFADADTAPAFDPEKATYRFPAGAHKLDRRLVLRSNESVYLAPGAVVYGEVESTDSENVAVFGGGILDGSLVKRQTEGFGDVRVDGLVHFTRCKNVVMDGVILRDPALWTVTPINCENVRFHNVKLIGLWRYNADGFDFVNSRNVHVSDCFLRTFDDGIVIKGLYFGDPERRDNEAMNNENYLIENCVVWCDWGGALEVGAETVADEYNNLVYRNCDIIRNDQGAMRLNCGDRALIRHVLYDDIRVEYSRYNRQPVYQETDGMVYAPPEEPACADAARVWQYCDMWSPDHLLGHVRDVTYRNIQIQADKGVPQPGFVFNSADETHYIDGVTIENVTFNGAPTAPRIVRNEYTKTVNVK